MALETVTHISDLVATNPTSDDPKSQGDNHIRNVKTALLTDLPNITGPVTANQAELNILDGATLSTAELNVLDGITATTAELNFTDGVTSNIQTQLDGKQAADDDLTALAGLSTAGIVVRTGAGTAGIRQLQAGSGVSIINADGVAGDPTISLSPTVGAGDVLGPASSTDGAVALFDGTSGKQIKVGSATFPASAIVGISDTQTLTNKTVALGSNTVSGTLAQFNTACTDADFVSLAGAETLTNKTLTSPAISGPTNTGAIYNNGSQRSNIVAVGALDIDCSAGNYFTKTIATNSTFTFSNAPASRAYAFTLEVTHTSGTITWPAAVQWPAGTAPTLTTGKTHLFTFVTDDGGTRWRGVSSVNFTN